MDAIDYIKRESSISESGSSTNFVTLSAKQLKSAIVTLAHQAHSAECKLASVYRKKRENISRFNVKEDVELMSQLQGALRYGHLATSMHYLKQSRVPFLPEAQEFEIFVDSKVRDDFDGLVSGRDYSLDALSHIDNWVEIISTATDIHIPESTIHKQAASFSMASEILLRPSLADPFKKRDVYETIRLSSFGQHLVKQTESFGYDPLFIDLRAFNFVKRDQGKAATFKALCHTNYMFIDMNLSPVAGASALAHEAAHGEQFHKHRPDDIAPYQAFREAHPIAVQYLVAAELLSAGVDPKSVHETLYGFSSETVNLLRTDPAQFLIEVTQSDIVREKWKFEDHQTKVPPRTLIEEYADSLRPLCAPWQDLLPQPT